MNNRRARRQSASVLEIFVDPLFGAFGAFLFIFLMVILMVGVVGRKPDILTERLPDGFAGLEYEVWLSAQGGVGDYEWSLPPGSSLPNGLVLDSTGYLRGKPQMTQSSHSEEERSFRVIVTALRLKTDRPEDAQEMHEYSLRILRDKPILTDELLPVEILTESPLPDGTVGFDYNVTLAASGGLPPYIWKCDSPLPQEMDFRPTAGRLTGIPRTKAEKVEIAFSVSDSRPFQTSESRDSRVLTLSILPPPIEPPPPPDPPEIVTEELPVAIEALPYTAGLTAQHGAHPLTWSLDASMPTWLSLDSDTGIITGTPPWESRGKVRIGVSVRDSLERECVNPFRGELEIRPQMGTPIGMLRLLTKNLPRATLAKPYEAPIAICGGLPPFHFSVNGLPPSLNLGDDGIITGLPQKKGRSTLSVMIEDSHTPPQQCSGRVVLPVEEQARPLEILTSSALPTARVGRDYDVALSAVGGNGVYEWSVSDGLPAGLSFESGRITGIPEKETMLPATFDVTVEEKGLAAEKAQKKLVISVMSQKEIPPLDSPRWFWLLVVFATSWLVRRVWQNFCLKRANQ